ncbi:MAG: MFS transporter [Euryarchaeota archaeon]|nr:MFS transporter [Euryarchaeota archaeon]MCD6158139.1 MFS transporter [Euryarchaeota archaeon]
MNRKSSRSLSLLFVISAIRGVGAQVFMTFLPVYAVSVASMTTPEVGVVSAIATGVSVVFLPVFGYLADFIGRRFVMLISTILRALAPVVVIFMRSYDGVLLAYILSQLSMYSWISARGAFVAESVSGRHMGKTFAALALPMQVSRAIMPYISGIIIVYMGYDVIFIMTSLLILLGIPLIFSMGESVRRSQGEVFSLREFLRGLIPKRKELRLQTFFIVDRASWRFWMPMLNSYLKEYLGLPEDIIGLVSTIRGIASALAVMPSGFLVDTLGWRLGLFLSEITGTLAVLMLVLGRSVPLILLASALIGLSIALWTPGFNTSVTIIADDRIELGRVYSRANFYRVVASVPSPWIGSILYDIAPVMMFLAGFLGLALNCLVVLTVREEKPTINH